MGLARDRAGGRFPRLRKGDGGAGYDKARRDSNDSATGVEEFLA
jgi:hypothetical protein